MNRLISIIVLIILSFSLSFAQTTVPARTPLPELRQCTFTYAAGASNVTNITVAVKDSGGNVIPGMPFYYFQSTSPSGDRPTNTVSGSGTNAFTILGSVGTLLSNVTTNTNGLAAYMMLNLVSSNVGTVALSYTDSNKPTDFPVVFDARTGRKCIGPELATANYGFLIIDEEWNFSSRSLEALPRERFRLPGLGKDRG